MADALAALLNGLQPVPPEPVPLAEALGLRVADAVASPPLPATAVALAPGYAVSAADLVGADAYSPAFVPMPPAIAIDQPLPSGTDAVLAADAVQSIGGQAEIVASLAPGTRVRQPGEDWPGDTALIPAEHRIGPADLLACQRAGLTHLPIRRPRVVVEQPEASPATALWLTSLAVTWGCRTSGPADLILRLTRGPNDGTAAASHHGLALAPGESAGVGRHNGTPVVLVPARFDGAVAAVVALVLPVLAQLLAMPLRQERHPVAAKIASAPGVCEVVLLQRTRGRWQPLMTGDVTLAALMRSDAVALIPPDSEGLAEGSVLAGLSLSQPFAPMRGDRMPADAGG